MSARLRSDQIAGGASAYVVSEIAVLSTGMDLWRNRLERGNIRSSAAVYSYSVVFGKTLNAGRILWWAIATSLAVAAVAWVFANIYPDQVYSAYLQTCRCLSATVVHSAKNRRI